MYHDAVSFRPANMYSQVPSTSAPLVIMPRMETPSTSHVYASAAAPEPSEHPAITPLDGARFSIP